MKLNLYISRSGYCSRRNAALLIKGGKVLVDNKVVAEPWFEVGGKSSVKVEGKLLRAETKAYLVFNKPKGVTTTLSDKFAEKTITEYIPKSFGRLYPVGRLDKLSRGLLLLTNDGDLCYRLTHPKFEIEKEYLVTVKGHFDDATYAKLKEGVWSEQDVLKVRSAHIEKSGQDKYIVRTIVCEGKKRHLRRLFEALGFQVLDLKRIRMGALKLGNLKEGSFRMVDKKEFGL